MTKFTAAILIGLTALALTGCGRNPTGNDYEYERVVHAGVPKAKTATTAKLPAPAKPVAQPFHAIKPTSSGNASTPAPTTSAKPAASDDAVDPNGPGSLSLKVNVAGTATVASLSLEVTDAADPTNDVKAPLTIAAGVASWSLAQIAAGNYNFVITALDPDGKALGQAKTQATVKPNEPTDVTIDLRVNKADTSTDAPSAQPSTTPVAVTTPSAAPSSQPSSDGGTLQVQSSTAPSGATGGTLGLNLEIQ